MRLRSLSLIGLLAVQAFLFADEHPTETPRPSAHLNHQIWDSAWIAPADQPGRVYGVYHFRKAFELAAVPDQFVVNISADNRYRLFVNGTPVNTGPARGNLKHWRYDTLDLSPWLKAGRNVLAAQVWNFAEHGPVAQVTDQTAFILQGNSANEAIAQTDHTWKVFTNPAYTPITGFDAKLQTYIVVGPGDDVDASQYPWGWETPEFDDGAWLPAKRLREGRPRGYSTDGIWLLTPRQIPLMESAPLRLQAVRRDGGSGLTSAFLRGGAPVTIPAHSSIKILLDQEEITTAFPELTVSGGQDSQVKLTYAEALYEGPDSPASTFKGNRDVVENKNLRGFEDIFRPDGSASRTFRPLRWRTWRYLEIAVETGDHPITLVDLTAEYTAYPFAEKASFESSDPTLARIWELAWRTIRTGTHEIFADSPFYEQLSYVGDTRIEALVSVMVSGDDRMMRKSIEAFDESRNPNGLTSSRWPDSRHQIIPPYSWVWISMVHDYWMLRDDTEFVEARLAGVREVLRYFDENSDPLTGSYTQHRWWNFVDWIAEWGKDPITGLGGVPPMDAGGSSAILDLQYVYTLQHAAELFSAFGQPDQALVYQNRAAKLRRHVLETCWNEERQLLADNSDQETFSQHANTFLILTAGDQAGDLQGVAERMLTESDVIPATFYFCFYTHQALIDAGLGQQYLTWLDPWRGVLEMGLTTIPEKPTLDTRSDAHAWGSHPMLGMLTNVCGISSGSPGFETVRIAPELGPLNHAQGSVPHPLGPIKIELKRRGDAGITATITLPEKLTGEFVWRGHQQVLGPGTQKIQF